MILGETARKCLQFLTAIFAIATLFALPGAAFAQAVSEIDAVSPNVADETLPAAEAVEGSAEATVVGDAAPAFDYYGPEMIKGQPVSGADDFWESMTFQPQFTDNGEYALGFHDYILMPLITAISLFVLALLLWVIVRYNRRANTVPSKTSHNTLIEIVWTVVPVLILLAIAVPSITLLARQYESPPENAVTIKATGYQWYWGYTYVDNGGFEVISNMMDESEALGAGEPPQLAVDNRMVVPVGVPLRIQTTGADVIHSFGIPSLWFKIDAVPGRINEHLLTINEPGIYYGQCMELCGSRHGYMPIAIEARPLAEFEAWVRSQPGGVTRAEAAAAAAAEAAAAAATEAVPLQEPESAVEDAPGAGAAPTLDTAPTT